MDSFCIIGLGRFGKKLAISLIKQGNQVMVIDKNEDNVSDIADEVTESIAADATNEQVLTRCGISNYDCVVIAFSKNINESILLTLMLKDDFKVKKVVVRASNEQHRRVLVKLGITDIVFPEYDMAEKLAYKLDKKNVLEFTEFDEQNSIAEVKMPLSWVGKSLRALDVRRIYSISVIAIKGKDGQMNVTINPDVPLAPNQTLLILGSNDRIEEISALK